MTGPVSDIRPYLARATAMVAPLFHGGGTRFKILEAFAARLPVMSTAKGSEGLETNDEKHLLIADDGQGFVECLHRLRVNKLFAENVKNNALDLVRRNYSWDVVKRRVRRFVEQLEENKKKERR